MNAFQKSVICLLGCLVFSFASLSAQTAEKSDKKKKEEACCTKKHQCSEQCSKGNHVYKHGEKKHVCSEACAKDNMKHVCTDECKKNGKCMAKQ